MLYFWYLTLEINDYIQRWLFGKCGECALNAQWSEMHCLWFLFLCMSLAVHYSLCEQEVSGVAKKGSGKVQRILNVPCICRCCSLKKIIIFLGILFLESQKPSKGLSFYFIHSFKGELKLAYRNVLSWIREQGVAIYTTWDECSRQREGIVLSLLGIK